ncbi:uncharacterized protein Tco025E_03391 [Trypanosoma conorhini]|uniref:Transmembrane protein n=1 Tax=Trypanosoma conorhini TaxID=83891 RepID=A0A422PV87_9TRYP|nr:uncharacterized protein Tco025E_03391 [Trypanosoma conorhini]RNF21417.1 hypothetical protein Tco025E_03391 [Trypanosoma conorhini]
MRDMGGVWFANIMSFFSGLFLFLRPRQTKGTGSRCSVDLLTLMQRRRVRSVSTRSGARCENHRGGAVSSRETVKKRRSSKVPLLVERSANRNELSQHDSETPACERRSQLVLRGDCTQRPSSASFSSRQVNMLPAFCVPHYRWSPLHTSCAHAVAEEHEAVIQWYEQNIRPGDVNLDDEVGTAWLSTARSRCDALCTFAQEHRTLYGSLDADKLQEMEACLFRLLLCVKGAEEHWSLLSTRSSVGASRKTTRTACQQTVPREKHISFAKPLFHFFSSVSLPENDEPSGGSLAGFASLALAEEDSAAEDEDVADAPYKGRSSGVYYGDIFSALEVVEAIPAEQPILEETNALSRPQPQQRLSGPIATECTVENVLHPVFHPYRLFLTIFGLGSGVWRRRRIPPWKKMWLYILVTSACCVLSLLVVCRRW